MSAEFSHDKKYRWVLRRQVGSPGGGNVVFIGVNPSTADAASDDATVRRLKSFTDFWFYSSFSIVNPFSLVSSTPAALAQAADPIGKETDYWIRKEVNDADLVVPMWGDIGKVPPHLRYRFDDVKRMIGVRRMKVFGLTKHGHPQHPLYLPTATKLKDWTP